MQAPIQRLQLYDFQQGQKRSKPNLVNNFVAHLRNILYF